METSIQRVSFHSSVRRFQGHRHFKGADNPSEIVILEEWDSFENAKKYAQSDGKQAMQRGGVSGIPDVYVSTN